MTTTRSDNASSDFLPADIRQSVVAQVLPNRQMGITRLTSHRRDMGRTAPHELEHADLIVLQLRAFGEQEIWLDGRPAPFVPYAAGTVTVHDLDREWVADLKGEFDCIHFHLPRETLEETVDEMGGRRRPQLYLPPHLSVPDAVVHSIGRALLPALAHPESVSQIFLDHVALAFQAHVAQQYGGVSGRRRKFHQALAPWQERRAKERLLAQLDGHSSIDDVARDCGLTRGAFFKAFHQTTGLTPHRWLIVQRVEHAKVLMRAPHLGLSAIALACGFADQSHFTRTFTRVAGVNPSRWRADNAR